MDEHGHTAVLWLLQIARARPCMHLTKYEQVRQENSRVRTFGRDEGLEGPAELVLVILAFQVHLTTAVP